MSLLRARAQDMASTLAKAGLGDTLEENAKIMDHFLEVGKNVRPDANVDVASELVGPTGSIKALSTWTILPDGRTYLSTIKLIPRGAK